MDFLSGKNAITIEPIASYGLTSPEEKISKVLARWTALQLAVENEWGGCDSLAKSHQLASDILNWLCKSKAQQIEVEELENLLHERLLLSFNTEIEDGSIEEVAEQLMIIREEAFPSKTFFRSIK